MLPDTPANRKKLQTVMTKIEADMALGKFDYARYFPNSPMLNRLAAKAHPVVAEVVEVVEQQRETPLFSDFADQWFEELRPTWRTSTAKGYRAYLDKRLNPFFGNSEVGRIDKADILKFRSTTAKLANGKLKPKTINKFMKLFKMIIDEAAIRFDFITPYRGIKPLKEEKVHIEPFSLDEVNKIINHVRADWRTYMIVRFFTGMHSGEIEMNQLVFEALLAHREAQGGLYETVFVNRDGEPVHNSNFLHRVWTPLLAYLGIPYRRPYETRHTAATLWLAAGENPTWIAKQMGHSNTEMLFTVYTRYVPNLTRQDGSAMERLIAQGIQLDVPKQGFKINPVADELSHWDALLVGNASSARV